MDNIDYILENRDIFHKTIYTPLSEALVILEQRRNDKKLAKKIESLIGDNIPDVLKENKNNAVMFRQIPTPNYEVRSFLDIANIFELNPIFFEYDLDKFTSNNSYKHSLGQLILHKDYYNKKGEILEEKITIVDFPVYDGKKLSEVNTLWGQDLIDFHKKLFDIYNININEINVYNVSEWIKNNGGNADGYYYKLLLLFIKNGILFENFLLSEPDLTFTRNVFMPAFIKITDELGVKPIIVPIPPMDIEIEESFHWHSHDHKKIKPFINNFIK